MSDYTPTPEAVEAAARAIDPFAWWLRENGTFPLDHPASTSVVIDSQKKATAALTAAGPLIAAQALREAAEEMEREGNIAWLWYAKHLRTRSKRIARGEGS